jgi:hypothetical protein
MNLIKFNTIFEEVSKSLIKEEFKSTRLKSLFDQDREEFTDKKLKETISDAKSILLYSLPDSARGFSDIEKVHKFLDQLVADKRKLNKITLIEEYLKYIAPDENTLQTLLTDLNQISSKMRNIQTVLNFAPINKSSNAFSMLLSSLDAANISDDDLQIFKKSENDFKDFNKKARQEFTYAIGVKNNKCVGIIEFDADRTCLVGSKSIFI